jgi:NAD(P)-dependent dehydrogenase (short-subunit alcohol dehydrogenase family)
MSKNNELAGKVVVITGASSGFGKGAARKFAQAGCTMLLAARRSQLLDELAEQCNKLGGQAISVPTDVSEEREVGSLAQQAMDRFGRIDIWINDAGVGAVGRFEEIPLADHVQVIATDLLGTLYGTYFAYRQFLKQGHGTLINIASELGQSALPYYASYTAAKHGVVGLGASLNQEMEQNQIENVYVCTVMPTAYDTPFFEHAANYTGHVLADDPEHDPAEVVETILKLAEDPKEKKAVSSDGVFPVLLKTIAPGVAEKKSAKDTHEQIEEAPPAPKTSGAVRSPMSHGFGVRASRRLQKN